MCQKFQNPFLLFLLFLAFLACRKERPSPTWDVDILTPLMVDTIRVADVLNDTLFVENPDHSLAFVFDEKLYEVNIDSLVKLPDTLFSWAFGLSYLPFPITLLPGDTIIKEVFDWPLDVESFNLQGMKLERADIRSGNIVFEVLDQSQTDLLCVLGINSAIRNEVDTFKVAELVPDGQSIAETYDFSDYFLNLKGADLDTFNMLNYYLALIVHPDEPSAITLYATDSFAVNIYFEDIVLDYAQGYFGKNSFSFGPDEYPVDLFSDLNIGNLSFDQANVQLKIENNYGMEAEIKLNDLNAKNSSTGESVALQSPMLDSLLFIDRAVELAPGSGQVIPTWGNYDFSSSNFSDLFSIQPDVIEYSMDIDMNVLGDSTNYSNFFYYDHPIRVFVEGQVDQGIRIGDMFVQNTVNWNASGIQLDKVSGGYLIVSFTNGFPLSFDLNLYLEDKNHEVLDTLVWNEFVEPGLVSGGEVTEAVNTRINVALDEQLKSSIKSARFGRYELWINTAGEEGVRIFSDDVMQIKLIGDFTYTIEP